MKLVRSNWLVMLGHALVLIIALFMLYQYWADRYASNLRLSQENLRSVAQTIDATVKSAQDHVEILQEEAERVLASPLATPNPLRLALRPDPAGGPFALHTLPPGADPASSTYLTGHGDPQALPAGVTQEIDAILTLSPLFQRVRHNVPQAVWVYYTSANRFVALHPFENQAAHPVLWSDEMLAHTIVADTAPERNPAGRHRWSPAYVDEAGKGLMSSRVAPVLDPDGRFRGIVALDITLGTLRSFLTGPSLQHGPVLLANDDGQLLADSGKPPATGSDPLVPKLADRLPPPLRALLHDDGTAATGEYREQHGWLLHSVRLEHVPWTLYHVVDRSRMQWAVFTTLHGAIAAMLLIVFLLVLFEQWRRNLLRLKTFRAAVEASQSAIVITDRNAVIEYANPAFSHITGYTRREVEGRTPAILKSGKTASAVYRDLWHALTTRGTWQGEILDRRKNGEEYWADLHIATVRGPRQTIEHYVGIINDISLRKLHEDAIRRQANFDALTGLANRSLLQDRLEHAIAHARRTQSRVGVVFIDLDGFKWINDTLGHDVGDELLVEVAQRLTDCVREQDTVARLGGDEFTIVVEDLHSPEDLNAVGEKVVTALRHPYSLGKIEHRMSGSVGITVYPEDGQDVKTLFRNADIAMYKSKQAGKNRYQFYSHDMQADALARMQLETDLRIALDAHAFELHYQPIVDADSGELVGAEALLRWNHPERGPVSPLEFIPVAEDSGLIIPIGEWALREAARQAREWRDRGHGSLRLSVNMSAVQFREPRLPELISRILEEYGIDRGSLFIEITESVLMGGSDVIDSRMRAIKSLGIRYALDDFGTGFSSLSYLKRFPVDVVKIDRSFIGDCPDDRSDAHLVEAIINMAHSLDLSVTAEGVESEAQVSFLRDLGCDYLQGYAISKPLPPGEFSALLERHLLLPGIAEATPEETRLLTALRHDELDVDDWLRRLLGERSPELAAFAQHCNWSRHGLDLREAVKSHLEWRKRLNDYIAGRPAVALFDVDHASSIHHCELGHWIVLASANGHPHIDRLDRAHREFHRLAGQIIADHQQGYQASARRNLAGLKFRTASRSIVIALIDCFIDTTAARAEASANSS